MIDMHVFIRQQKTADLRFRQVQLARDIVTSSTELKTSGAQNVFNIDKCTFVCVENQPFQIHKSANPFLSPVSFHPTRTTSLRGIISTQIIFASAPI